MATGILGGSFNPPHLGHLALAGAALASGRVDSIVLVPAAAPPHKAIPDEADAATRFKMTLLLADDDRRLEVDGIELERAGRSYTIDTVRELLARNPKRELRLIIGSDMALMFEKWKDYGQLLRLAPPLVAERPDALLEGGAEPVFPNMPAEEAAILSRGFFPMEPVAISSTMIRKRFGEGADDREMARYLPLAVLRYIREKGLYTKDRPS